MKPDNDVDAEAEELRDARIEELSEKLWHLARITNGTAWNNQLETMNLQPSEQAVGDWLRRLRAAEGHDFAVSVHQGAIGYGEEMISRAEADLEEMRRGQAVLERPTFDLVRTLLRVAQPVPAELKPGP